MTPRQIPLDFAPAAIRSHGYADAHARPLVSRELPTTFRVAPEGAWRYPYIELRTGNSWPLLGFDCDRPAEAYDALVLPAWLSGRVELPEPSVVVQRRANEHMHVSWFLKKPVHRGEKARAKPLLRMAKISEFYRHRLRADPGYNGVLTHNPCRHSPDFQVTWGRPEAYSLDELAEVIPKGWRVPSLPTTEVGRNCSLFRGLMRFAGSPDNKHADLRPVAEELNAQFDPHCLGAREVGEIVKSVCRYRRQWIEQGRYFTEAQRSTWARKAQAAMVEAVRAGRRERDVGLWQDWVAGYPQAEIARRNGVAQQTVSHVVRRLLGERGEGERARLGGLRRRASKERRNRFTNLLHR